MKTALVAMMNKDHDYVQEWIKYHFHIGFSDIYIFTEPGDKATSDIGFEQNVHVETYPVGKTYVQCFNDFIDRHNKDYDFCMMLDIDEFLYVKNDFCVDGLLYRLVDFDSVLVNFRIFGDSGLQYSNDNRSVLRFVKSDSKLNKHGKPIINLKKTGNRMKFINSNFIIDTETGKPSPGVDPNKKKMIFSSQENDDDELAEIFCFKAKTLGEFLIRNNLPPDTSPEQIPDQLVQLFSFWNRNSISNVSLVTEFNKITQKENVDKYCERCRQLLPSNCKQIDFVLFDYRYRNDARYVIRQLSRKHTVVDMSNTMFETYDDPKNFHHWTTRYVWNTFIPTLLKHLDIDVDLTKFTYVERIIDGLDVSFHELQNDQTFNAVNLTTREHFDGKDHRRILRLGDGENIKDGTPYHKTFRFAHQTGIIKNDKPLIDKKILMTCDSMGIPIAPFLAYVFREVFVRDFRFGVKCRELIKEFKPDYFISIYLTNDYRSNLSIMNGLM